MSLAVPMQLTSVLPQIDDVLLEQEYTLHEVHGVVVSLAVRIGPLKANNYSLQVLLVASSISVIAVLGLLLAIFVSTRVLENWAAPF